MSNWGLRPSHVGYYAAVSRKVVQQKTVATMPKSIMGKEVHGP